MSQKLQIPDTLANWKWPRHLNPHYLEVKRESAAWAAGFRAFNSKAQLAFDRCDFNLLAALAYPLADRARLRSGCDLMNLFFVIDEYSDVADVSEVKGQVKIILDALRNPYKPRPNDEWVGGEIARQFWELAIKTASAQAQKRFVQTFEEYLQSVILQASDRERSHIRNIDSYLKVRRDTIGAKPSYALLEFDMNLPDEVISHPILQELTYLSIDMLCLGNDIVSYNLEQARGDDAHNIVTIVMHQFKTDAAGAMKWVAEYHASLERKFNDAYLKVPKWGGPLDLQVARYVDGLGNWVRANDQWSFESERYFGNQGLRIMKTRTVTLLPKERTEAIGPQVVDGSLL
ncbi:terpenoid synthase [Dentipellis sp. KUC8613]|nr:terpenoid synthase [Dentipellis sp. KUC8613]